MQRPCCTKAVESSAPLAEFRRRNAPGKADSGRNGGNAEWNRGDADRNRGDAEGDRGDVEGNRGDVGGNRGDVEGGSGSAPPSPV